MDFFTFPLIELTVAQFSFLCVLYFLISGLVLSLMDPIVDYICKFIRRIYKHDKD